MPSLRVSIKGTPGVQEALIVHFFPPNWFIQKERAQMKEESMHFNFIILPSIFWFVLENQNVDKENICPCTKQNEEG